MARLSALKLALTLMMACTAAQAQQQAQCGAAGALCGVSLPKGSPCAKAPGFCQAGLFCGRCVEGSQGCTDASKSTCTPVPQGCGTKAAPQQFFYVDDPVKAAPYACCPPNAGKPLVGNPAVDAQRAPSCAGGLTCVYSNWPMSQFSASDPYAYNYVVNSPLAAGTCLKVASDCGTPGKSCCPNPYHTAYNPAPPGMLCNRDPKASAYCGPAGLCVANPSNCGTVGNACCVTDTGVSTNQVCNGSGPTYCAQSGPNGKPPMCTACPADWATKFAKSSNEYFGCQLSVQARQDSGGSGAGR
ncbi:MAG: hypothetical protein J3K34DRAFT_398899 [Monoraphidium minutum]|nr:MAG: hypothetical protein J3K34DRAFT_398899 [Monoraphidium minutum]